MFKKILGAGLIVVVGFSMGSASAAVQKLSEKTKMKAYMCAYWACPATFMDASGLNAVLEIIDVKKGAKILDKVREDAQFFADRVLRTEAGADPVTNLYRKVIVKLEAGDRVTSEVKDLPKIIKSQATVTLNTQEAINFKINGRPLISKELNTAHTAAQNLIFDGVVKSPSNELKSATNALLINQMVIEY